MTLILKGVQLHPPKNVLHSHGDPDWYTPSLYVEAARTVMGGIDMDPATDAVANTYIQATVAFTKQDNGLKQLWKGRIFLNPPGDEVNAFWEKLVQVGSEVEQFIWIGFSLEQLQTLQCANTLLTPLDFPLCVPRKRISFVENAAKRQRRMDKCLKEGKSFHEKTSPSHANYIAYHGPKEDVFRHVFSKFGKVRL